MADYDFKSNSLGTSTDFGAGLPRPQADAAGGEAAPRGLSNINKVSSVDISRSGFRLYNKHTGQVIEVDPAKSRVRRLQKRVFALANALSGYLEQKRDDYRLVMYTLTYVGVNDWRPNHIREFMLGLRKAAGKGLKAYAWVAELQARGAVHYHVLVLVRRGTSLPMPDKSGLWPYGLTKTETARTVFYICRYAGKEYQKVGRFPKGLRMFAVWVSKDMALDLARWVSFRLSALPTWLGDKLKEQFDRTGQAVHARRRVGGGWTDDNGENYASPWTTENPALLQKAIENAYAGARKFAERKIARLPRLIRLKIEQRRILHEWQERAMTHWGSLRDD